MSACIDIHTHVVPERFPPYAGRGTDVPWPSMADAHACHKHVMISGKVYRTVADGCWSVPRRIADMGAMRVARQALSPMPELLSYWLPLADAKVLIRYLNDDIAAMVAQAPDRFVGLGAVPLQDAESAIRELEYVVGTLKFAGVEIASHVNGASIGDPHFEPFFAAVERLGAAVFVHALRPAGQDRIVGAFPEQAVCFPGDIALAAASMITGGIAARHPRLRIAFSHGGGAMSILLPRLEHAWNVFPKAKESISEVARRGVVAARELIARHGLGADREGIRAARQLILAQPEASPVRPLVHSPDLYSASGARDLVLHVQEHRFTAAQLADSIRALGLEFLGFELADRGVRRAYRERFPEDPTAVSLGNWGRFEAEHPHVFAGMYQFWAGSPA